MVAMRIYLSLIIALIGYCSIGECIQPYFPPQITFSIGGNQQMIAIDEINQRAYQSLPYGSSDQEMTWVMQHFPYAIPDSAQSNNYVQLLVDSTPSGCMYGTYWKYGGNVFNSFPSHWLINGSSYKVQNYIKFKYEMIHSTNESMNEDYWYANVTCAVDSGETFPCEEIYFQKNTDIPLRFAQVVRRGWNVVRATTEYRVLSVGKPDEKLFDAIPKNWTMTCRDVILGLFITPQSSKLTPQQSVDVQIWLPTPPHRINGSDTVHIQWKVKQCEDCLTWSPKELVFNGKNFQEKQNFTITRVKNSGKLNLLPVFNGGGFELVPSEIYPIIIE